MSMEERHKRDAANARRVDNPGRPPNVAKHVSKRARVYESEDSEDSVAQEIEQERLREEAKQAKRKLRREKERARRREESPNSEVVNEGMEEPLSDVEQVRARMQNFPLPSDPEPVMMQIFVKTVQGKTITLDYGENMTFGDILVHRQVGANFEYFHVVFAGMRKCNTEFLRDHGIEHESTFHVVPHLKGNT